MEQWMFNIFSGTGAFIIGFLVWIGRSIIKNTEGLMHLKEEVREDVKRLEIQIDRIDTRLETQINRIDTRLDYILILNRRPMDDVSSRHDK